MPLKKLKIAIFSSGNELVKYDETELKLGQIRDSNQIMLHNVTNQIIRQLRLEN